MFSKLLFLLVESVLAGWLEKGGERGRLQYLATFRNAADSGGERGIPVFD
jgi:hypothetical protein